MQGSSYFHRQANTCLRLSASCTDQNLANRFQAMAQAYIAKAAGAKVDDEDECLPLSEHAQGDIDPRPLGNNTLGNDTKSITLAGDS
jgi:hypothetical protein